MSRDVFATARVAHESLQGPVDAPAFSAGEPMSVAAPAANLHASPEAPGLQRQVPHGHPVTVLETQAGRAFLRDEVSGYVGWAPERALGPRISPTHRIAARATLVFAEPDFKCPDPVTLSCGAQLEVSSVTGRFAALKGGGHAVAAHLVPLTQTEDPFEVALRLMGTPYLWGGDTSAGIDCSGLVRLSLTAAHHPCPGDSDQQEAVLGATVDAPRRGDIVFWHGHVALMADDTTLIHANAHHMAVALEPFAEACARIAAQGDGPVTRIARLPAPS